MACSLSQIQHLNKHIPRIGGRLWPYWQLFFKKSRILRFFPSTFCSGKRCIDSKGHILWIKSALTVDISDREVWGRRSRSTSGEIVSRPENTPGAPRNQSTSPGPTGPVTNLIPNRRPRTANGRIRSRTVLGGIFVVRTRVTPVRQCVWKPAWKYQDVEVVCQLSRAGYEKGSWLAEEMKG